MCKEKLWKKLRLNWAKIENLTNLDNPNFHKEKLSLMLEERSQKGDAKIISGISGSVIASGLRQPRCRRKKVEQDSVSSDLSGELMKLSIIKCID